MTLQPRDLVRRTPLVAVPALGDAVYLKLESVQRTGSFKLRGAVSACESLSASERARGLVVASAGNHGAAMALVTQVMAVDLTVVVPRGTPTTKLEKIAAKGGTIVAFDGDYDAAEAHARQLAASSGAVFISAFDDERVIAGNGGSLGAEIAAQLDNVARVIVPVGGGGMIAGISRHLAPRGVEVIGAQPEQNCAMHDSLVAGRHLTEFTNQPTIAEGCEGAVGPLAFSIAREHIDRVALVSEDEIEDAVRFAYNQLGAVIECSGAVGLAALLAGRLEPVASTVCVVSGGNIDEAELDRILGNEPRR